jgi:hypothetical protein
VKPVLFAEDPKASEAAILKDPLTALRDLERLNRCFFNPETVELQEALSIVRKPRTGEADYCFKSQTLERTLTIPQVTKGKHTVTNSIMIIYHVQKFIA